jgi:hypothetical protein
MYLNRWMNDMDFYVIPMLYHRDSSGFFAKLHQKKFSSKTASNCLKTKFEHFLMVFRKKKF